MLLFLWAPLQLCMESSMPLAPSHQEALHPLGDTMISFPLGSRSFIPSSLLKGVPLLFQVRCQCHALTYWLSFYALFCLRKKQALHNSAVQNSLESAVPFLFAFINCFHFSHFKKQAAEENPLHFFCCAMFWCQLSSCSFLNLLTFKYFLLFQEI